MDDASFASGTTFDETVQTFSCSSLGRPSEAVMTATQGATTAAGAGGRSPPFRGRTMKEYEEMLAQLRKENFNLKLRLYFLEERGGALGDGSGGEAGAAVRAELEQLRREAAEKQQLLCEAARAVELLEEQHHEQLRAARAAAHQAQAEAQHARAAAAAAAADAQRARQEADAEAAAAREAAAKAAAEAAAEAEQMRLELRQAREAALEAAEAARAARAVRASPSSPTSSAGGGGSPENARLRGAVERAQAQLSALEGELGAVRAELRRQTEARAAAERGLAEGRAVHAKSLQTVQALARLCKERDREAEGLRARLRRERSDAAGADEEAAPRSPSASPSPPPPSATSTPPASPSPRAPPATPPPSPADPAAAVTLRRRAASSSASLGSPAREDAAVQADDPPSGDAAVHTNVTLREVEVTGAWRRR